MLSNRDINLNKEKSLFLFRFTIHFASARKIENLPSSAKNKYTLHKIGIDQRGLSFCGSLDIMVFVEMRLLIELLRSS